jgi:hypothetical protein
VVLEADILLSAVGIKPLENWTWRSRNATDRDKILVDYNVNIPGYYAMEM